MTEAAQTRAPTRVTHVRTYARAHVRTYVHARLGATGTPGKVCTYVRTYMYVRTFARTYVRTYVRAVEAESVRAYVRGGPGPTDTTRHIHARWRKRPGAFTRPGATGTPGAPGRSYARTYVRNQRAYFSPKSNFPEPRTKSKLRTHARFVRTYPNG